MIEYNRLKDLHASANFDLQDFQINCKSSCNTFVENNIKRTISNIITYIKYKRIKRNNKYSKHFRILPAPLSTNSPSEPFSWTIMQDFSTLKPVGHNVELRTLVSVQLRKNNEKLFYSCTCITPFLRLKEKKNYIHHVKKISYMQTDSLWGIHFHCFIHRINTTGPQHRTSNKKINYHKHWLNLKLK